MNIASAMRLTADRVVTPIEGMHRTISSRWFRSLGPIARPVQFAHDAVAASVYGAIRAGSAAVGWGIEARAPSAATTDSIQAWINGLWGDGLGDRKGSLGLVMTVRDASGRVVGCDAASSCVASPSEHLVFFVHGLVETERRWVGTGTGPALAQAGETGSPLSPVLIRYNTGLAVERNGAHLAELIQEVVDGWPVSVESIALVGHSMGGLVARSACVAAAASGRAWIDRVTDVVTIGTPHLGAPLERVAAAAAAGMNLTATTRPLAAFLHRRSQGIKDMGGGSTPLTSAVEEKLRKVRHHFIGGAITAAPSHPVGAMVGDLMVRPNSSMPSRFIEPSHSLLVGGVSHFSLLDDPSVIEHVTKWLDPADRTQATAPTAPPPLR